jgi:hypothetical protein
MATEITRLHTHTRFLLSLSGHLKYVADNVYPRTLQERKEITSKCMKIRNKLRLRVYWGSN